ncbi:unnamed protein product [Camellia sinensis]
MTVSLHTTSSTSCLHSRSGVPQPSPSCTTKVFVGLKLQSPSSSFGIAKPNSNVEFHDKVHKSIQSRTCDSKPTRARIGMIPIGTPRVPYRTPGEGTWQWVDLWNALYRERIIFIGQHIGEEFSNQILATMLYLDSIDSSKRMYMYINGPGGDLTPSMAIYDTMQSLKSPVGTHCVGYAYNLAEKGNRFAMPLSRIALQSPAGAARGQADDIRNEANELLRIRDYLFNELPNKTGQPAEKLKMTTLYNKRKRAFMLGKKEMKLRNSDIKLIFYIDCGEDSITTKTYARLKDFELLFYKRRCKSVKRLDGKSLTKMFQQTTKGKSTNDRQNLARVITLYLCLKLLMPTASYTLSWSFLNYVDNLNNIKKYNWVEAIKDTLMNSIANANNKPRHVTGCVMLLLWKHTSLAHFEKVNQSALTPTEQEIQLLHINQSTSTDSSEKKHNHKKDNKRKKKTKATKKKRLLNSDEDDFLEEEHQSESEQEEQKKKKTKQNKNHKKNQKVMNKKKRDEEKKQVTDEEEAAEEETEEEKEEEEPDEQQDNDEAKERQEAKGDQPEDTDEEEDQQQEQEEQQTNQQQEVSHDQPQTPTKEDDKDKLISVMRAQMQDMEQKFMAELRKKDQFKEMSTKKTGSPQQRSMVKRIKQKSRKQAHDPDFEY